MVAITMLYGHTTSKLLVTVLNTCREGNGGLTVPTHHRTHEQSPATAANQGAAIVRSKYGSCISSLPRGSNGRGHTCVSGVSGRSVAGSSLPFPGAQRNLEVRRLCIGNGSYLCGVHETRLLVYHIIIMKNGNKR